MKKLLLLLLIVVGMSSCYVNVKDTVKDPKKATTVQLQELPKDTVLISTDGKRLYVFDENNLIVAKTVGLEKGIVPVHFAIFLLVLGNAFLLGVAFGRTQGKYDIS